MLVRSDNDDSVAVLPWDAALVFPYKYFQSELEHKEEKEKVYVQLLQ